MSRMMSPWTAALVIAALTGTVGSVTLASSGTVNAGAPDLFTMPTAEEFASATAIQTMDEPVPLEDSIDLGPALETAWSHFDAYPGVLRESDGGEVVRTGIMTARIPLIIKP